MDKFIQLPFGNPLTVQIDQGGIWHLSVFIGCVFIIWAAIWNLKMLATEAKILWIYLLTQAIYYFEYPAAHFGLYDTAFQAQAAQVFAEALIIPIGALFFSKRIFQILPFVILYELVCIWLKRDGLMIAASFDTTFCALAIPFLPWWMIYAVVMTALTHHGSTALVVIGAQLFAFAVKDKRLISLFLGASMILFTAAKWHSYGMGFIDGESRIAVYKKSLDFLTFHKEWIPLGVGPGSFIWTSLLMSNFQGGLWMQMHSDWLQIFWELGAVGFLLVILALTRSIRTAWDTPQLLAAIFGCVASCLTYHPMRFFPPALLIAFIFRQALAKPLLPDPEIRYNPLVELLQFLAIKARRYGKSAR